MQQKTTMRALQVTAPGSEFEIIEIPIPTPAENEALIKIEAVATCPQWELHLRHNEPMFLGHQFHYPYTPGQPGHEATGTITAVGTGVTEFAVGDRVSLWRDAGAMHQGCYAEYVARPITQMIKVPPHLSYEATASVELAMCVGATFLMLKSMNVLEGKRVGITGLGPAGLIAAQMARAEGASEIVGFDTAEVRCAFAAPFVDAAYNPTTVSEDDVPTRRSKHRLEVAVDCVGAKRSVEFLMDRTREVVALFGVQREDYTFAVRHYHLRLCGYPGHSLEAAQYAVGLMERGVLDLTPLITHRLPLSEYGKGIALLETQEAIKVCFYPNT